MSRRRLLMAIANQTKWLPYSYEYLYHNLIPSELPTFNIWNEEYVNGFWNESNGNYSTNDNKYISSKNKIRVYPNKTICIFKNESTARAGWVVYYDINENYIGYSNVANLNVFKTLTLPNNCHFITFSIYMGVTNPTYNHDICINESNAQLNGHYAPCHPRYVKNKVQIAKIEGNGEVENQLAPEINSTNYRVVSGSATITDGKMTLSGVSIIDEITPLVFKANHKYLVWFNAKSTLVGTARCVAYANPNSAVAITNSGLYTMLFTSGGITDTINFQVQTYTSGSVEITDFQFKDLTQEFGAGNEPTSLTDPRVQRIIAKGYQPKNTGTIKNTVIQEIETKGFNIWNEEWINGYYSPFNGEYTSSNQHICSKDFIKVLPNTPYYTMQQGGYVCFYDKNKVFISSYDNVGNAFTTPSNCKFIMFNCGSSYGTTYNHDICINRSGARNGEYVKARWQDFYQRVEYIESHGTEYIDTGFKPNQDTRVDTKFLLTQKANQFIFGARTGTGTTYTYYCRENTVDRSDYFWSNTELDVSTPLNTITHVNKDKNVVYYNGVQRASAGYADFQVLHNLLIFALSDGGNPILYCYGTRLYSFKIYNNGALVRDFIPVYRKADKVAGLYDLVNDTFYVNQGTGTFAVGADIPNDNVIQLPQPLELAGALNAHNTFEITSENYVFTRNVFDVGLDSLNWGGSSGAYGTGDLASIVKLFLQNQVPTILCSNPQYIIKSLNNATAVANSNELFFGLTGNLSIKSSSTPTGGLAFPLATPQVINIPRKHLSAVRLKDLNWGIRSYGANPYFSTNSLTTILRTNSNAYCSKYYLLGNFGAVSFGNTTNDKVYAIIYNTEIQLAIRDNAYSTVEDFVASLTDDDILFFETENEVADFVDIATCQAGGEINGKQPNIPVEYQEVEYIESTGTQYIDSGVKLNNQTKIECDFEVSDTPYYVLGTIEGGNTNTFVITFANATMYLRCGGATNASFENISVNTRHKAKMSVNSLTLDNSTQTIANTGTSTYTQYNCILFGRNYEGTIQTSINNTRIYSLIISNGSTLVRNFIPCYRKSDNVIGLYDKVEGKFYTNAGTGTFLKGANVNGSYDCEVLPNAEVKYQCK